MTKNIPPISSQSVSALLAEKRRLRAEKEILTAICLILTGILGVILIVI